ncbi:MAG: hypothetical protein ACYDCJ_12350 [Gammaproteobacteria bacterium]
MKTLRSELSITDVIGCLDVLAEHYTKLCEKRDVTSDLFEVVAELRALREVLAKPALDDELISRRPRPFGDGPIRARKPGFRQVG